MAFLSQSPGPPRFACSEVGLRLCHQRVAHCAALPLFGRLSSRFVGSCEPELPSLLEDKELIWSRTLPPQEERERSDQSQCAQHGRVLLQRLTGL